MALVGHKALKENKALKVVQVVKDLLELPGRMGHQAKMERKEKRAIKGLKECPALKVAQVVKDLLELTGRMGHLVKTAYRVLQAKKVTKASRADEDVEDHRVRQDHLEKEDARERADHLGQEGARDREGHLGKQGARAREEYREYKDCKAFRCIAYLPSRDDRVAST